MFETVDRLRAFVTWVSALKGDEKGEAQVFCNRLFQTFGHKGGEAGAAAAVALRQARRDVMAKTGASLREVYRTLDKPGKSPLKDSHAALNEAVRNAHGMPNKAMAIEFVLALNERLAKLEAKGKKIIGPGLPPSAGSAKGLVTDDALAL